MPGSLLDHFLDLGYFYDSLIHVNQYQTPDKNGLGESQPNLNANQIRIGVRSLTGCQILREAQWEDQS